MFKSVMHLSSQPGTYALSSILNRLLRSRTVLCVMMHLLQQELVLMPVLDALQVL